MIERFGTNVVSLCGNIALSYLLSPHDFGMVAMLSLFSSFILVFTDCGLSDGLLMHKSPTNRDFNTVFYFNVVVGVAICLMYFLVAPWVAAFFGHAELKSILRWLGVGAVFSSLIISQITRLRSSLQFRRVALLNLMAITVSVTIAIVMALNGYRYWALVELQVGYSFFYFVLLLFFSHWRVKLEFDVKRFGQLWGFGVNLLLSTIFVQLSQNVFTFILGKFYNPTQAGLMGQAQKMQQTPVNSLETSISSTSYIVIAKSENDKAKSDSFIKMFDVMTFVNTLFVLLLLSLSYPIIDFVFPDKWLPSVPYFRLLLVWAVVYPVCNFMLILFKLFNRTSIIRNVIFLEKTLIVVSAFVLYKHGVSVILGVSIGISLLALSLYCYFASRITNIQLSRFFMVFGRNVLLVVLVAAATFVTSSLMPSSLTALLAGVPLYMLLVLLVCRLFHRDYFDWIMSKMSRITLSGDKSRL